MRKAYTLLMLGIWVAILPYLGFPLSWKYVLFTITGLIIVCVSFVLYKEAKSKEAGEKTFDNFSENGDFSEREAEIKEQ